MTVPVCLFPVAPALDAVADGPEQQGSIRRLAARIGYHPRTILKWKEEGGVDVWTADLIATRLGLNAEQLWPGWEATADHVADERPEQLDLYDLMASA